MKRITVLFFALALAFGAGGCSSSDSSGSTGADSKFVGLWHMSLASDPADPGFDWRFNTDQTTIVLYDTGSTNAKGTGTCTITGDTSSGTWSISSANAGRFTATLTSDTTMDFDFIEDQYTPPKTFAYVGTRIDLD